ncbi:MAG TPA: apolipoprotein N-acyltransferase [Microvirga sp.]|jgi:apolipoprotein N-acyltransferase|nr:apolipoprotein N-acyltransferase [Microvirga sp.]
MIALAQAVTGAAGWRRWLIAFGAGAVGALAMPPFGILPALVFSLVPAVWLLDGARGSSLRAIGTSAAVAGWWWGFGYFVAGLWWLGAAFLVEADEFAWALPLGVLGLPAVLAFFPALGFLAARLLWSRGPLRLFAFAAGLTLGEWLRGHLFTGFPWNTPGMALGQHGPFMQAAAVVGLYGLTLLAVLIAAAPALAATGSSTRARIAPPVLAGLALLALLGAGALRVPPDTLATLEGVRLRIMQPNLPQDAKFHARNRDPILRHYFGVSARPGPDGAGLEAVTHLIWPESAFPFLLHEDAGALAQIGALLPRGTTLVTGAARMAEPLPGEAVGPFFNAVQVVDAEGTIVGSYDKTHLVPFGEYVPKPVEALIQAVGLRPFVHIPGGFSPAEARRVLPVPGLPPVAATVCYEAIFPGAVVAEGPRPSLILNLTNDAWFGETPGPYQHFAQARLRAVEEGLPLVRAANSGVSAVVDPYGRVLGALPLGQEGVLDAAVPVALPATLYSVYRDGIVAVMGLVCLALSLVSRVAHPRRAPVPSRA